MITLRLVPPLGQERPGPSRHRYRRRTCQSLTGSERRALRGALRNLRHAFGSWDGLAAAMDVAAVSLEGIASGRDRGSPGIALRAARAAGVPFERLISRAMRIAGHCSACGTHLGEDESTPIGGGAP
jgi:hypothetical protein